MNITAESHKTGLSRHETVQVRTECIKKFQLKIKEALKNVSYTEYCE